MNDIVKRKGTRLKLLVVAMVVLFNFGFATTRVMALDETFRSLNDIVFFSEVCSAGQDEGGSGDLVGNDNIEKVLRYYVGKDLLLVQAAAIVGNMMQESGVNPAKIQGGAIADVTYKMTPGVGFGLVQWTTGGRQQGLTTFAGARPITDLGVQLDYTWKELNESYKGTLDKLKAEKLDPVKAAIIFHDGYERSADSDETVKNVRGGNATRVYDQFRSSIPDGATAENDDTKVCTDNGGETKYANDNFVIYNQRDPEWNDVWYGGPESTGLPCPPLTKEQDETDPHGCVGRSGCGPSAMAMVITALTNQRVTPKDTAIWGRAHGSVYNVEKNGKTFAAGSLHNLHTSIGEHWKVTGVEIATDVASIEKGLRDGGLVVASGSGEAPWTSAGHFIVIRGISASGKWLVGDSNGKDNIGAINSKKEWDPADLASRIGNYHYLFTKS